MDLVKNKKNYKKTTQKTLLKSDKEVRSTTTTTSAVGARD